jgi:hypothetical protein
VVYYKIRHADIGRYDENSEAGIFEQSAEGRIYEV